MQGYTARKTKNEDDSLGSLAPAFVLLATLPYVVNSHERVLGWRYSWVVPMAQRTESSTLLESLWAFSLGQCMWLKFLPQQTPIVLWDFDSFLAGESTCSSNLYTLGKVNTRAAELINNKPIERGERNWVYYRTAGEKVGDCKRQNPLSSWWEIIEKLSQMSLLPVMSEKEDANWISEKDLISCGGFPVMAVGVKVLNTG